MTLLVSGSIVFDQIMNYPGQFTDHLKPQLIHKLSVSFDVERLTKSMGGTGMNICHTLGLLQQHCILL